jgi:hypothetical protein
MVTGNLHRTNRNMMKKKYIIALVIIAYPAIVLFFMPDVFNLPFDTETVTRFITPFTFQGHDTIGWAVMESTQWDIFRPVYSLSILLDHTMWGTDPLMYHISDLILSWICYAAAFFLLKRRFGLFIASAAVLLWALGPAQAMSLYRIFGRNDRLVNMFIVLALLLYDRYSDSSGRKRVILLGATVFSVILATLSKETGIYYAVLIPLWGLVVLKRRIPELLRSDLLLWIILVILGAAFFLLRHLAGFQLAIDSEGFVSAADYFRGMSSLILMGIPFHARFTFNPLLVCGLTAAAVSATVLIRRFPDSSRFGALAFAVVILPLSILWIESSFLWGFSLWVSLWAAGLISMAAEPVWSRMKTGLRWVLAVSSVAVLISYGLWSGRVAEMISAPMLQVSRVAMYTASVSSGPVYISGEGPYSEWWSSVENMPPRDRNKMLNYMSELVRLETGDPDARVVLSADR